MQRHTVTLTTIADGSVTGYSPRVRGKVHSIHYVKPGSGNYTDGVDFTVTAENTGESIWAGTNVNASTVVYPRAPTHSQAGAANLYAAGGTGINDKIGLASDRVKIVIAAGGDAKVGTFHILIDN